LKAREQFGLYPNKNNCRDRGGVNKAEQ